MTNTSNADHAMVLVAHGTRDDRGPKELAALTTTVARQHPEIRVALGYLSLIEPTAGQAIDRVIAAGATKVSIVPLLLTNASHARDDIPEIVRDAGAKHPTVTVLVQRPLGSSNALAAIATQRLRAANAAGEAVVVLGRGGSNAEANQGFASTVEALGETVGARTATAAFAAVAQPGLQDAIEPLIERGVTRIVFFGWLLAHGRLIAQARDTLHHMGAANDIDIIDAGYFLTDPAPVADAITAS